MFTQILFVIVDWKYMYITMVFDHVIIIWDQTYCIVYIGSLQKILLSNLIHAKFGNYPTRVKSHFKHACMTILC